MTEIAHRRFASMLQKRFRISREEAYRRIMLIHPNERSKALITFIGIGEHNISQEHRNIIWGKV